jgi:SAM-dependent methyltransferase
MDSSGIYARFFPEIGAGGFSRVDGTIQFYQRVRSLIWADAVVLDFGAGRGVRYIEDTIPSRRELHCLKGKVRRVIGADVDPVVKQNPGIDEAIMLGPQGQIPLPDRSVDIVVSDFTFEHIADPQTIARELDRVLAPGGWICARTPNRYGYIAMANLLLPKGMRRRVLNLMQRDRKAEDIFPAYYRLNTVAALRRCFDPRGYDHFVYAWDAEPFYHAGSSVLFRLFLIVHALSPAALKTMLLIFLHKKA